MVYFYLFLFERNHNLIFHYAIWGENIVKGVMGAKVKVIF
jgi:hypothetical protein